MQYSFISAAILALVSSVLAQTSGFDAITSPTQDQNITAGSSFDIIWQPGTVTGDITITLLQGADPSHLVAGPVVAKSISNSGKFTWTVPTTSSFATYGFEITLDSAPSTLQYSFPFHITGGSSSASSSASATGTGSTTTVHLSTGPSYTSSTPAVTSTSTTSVPSSTSTVISTSSSANSSSVSATLAPTSSSNITLSTTLTKATSTGTKTSATGSSTSSSASPVSTNAAATHIAGSLAMIGGIVIALAL